MDGAQPGRMDAAERAHVNVSMVTTPQRKQRGDETREDPGSLGKVGGTRRTEQKQGAPGMARTNAPGMAHPAKCALAREPSAAEGHGWPPPARQGCRM